LALAIAAAASPRTTTASTAYLLAAAAGAAGEAWHDLVTGIAQGDEPVWEGAVGRLAAIGHTSGADAVAGFLLVVEAVFHYLPGRPSADGRTAHAA
jgi:hypothetical protein